ncbi:hypothetical protein CEUSTIGMA_g6860.t1 [Chlamydomonas eustigma]|uniref:Peptidase M11 gametolysin domain-containing protein n=1 Tax=Chlamydomonas eustigma TaxID=1157962 RepID=A0A250X929_9CHLO|nr:hypothetical protein CEUSTIGMA_g6860.t1 [Chlamydomonas eustigma]|eukprot:GAX79419.1 hypothetical protein CEUSTIGMA_g6860.t1 [Chlamydomonas eustigma]
MSLVVKRIVWWLVCIAFVALFATSTCEQFFTGLFLKTDDGSVLHSGSGLFLYLNISASLNSNNLTPGCLVVVSCVEDDRPLTPGATLTVISINPVSRTEFSFSSRTVFGLKPDKYLGQSRNGKGLLQSSEGTLSALPVTDSPGTSDYYDNISSKASSSQPHMSRQQLLQSYTENVPRGMNMSSVFMIVSICSQFPSISEETLQSTLFGNTSAGEGPLNLGGYFGACSGNLASLSVSNSKILSGISLPCSGTSAYGSWSAYSCTALDFFGWADTASQIAADMIGSSTMSSFNHRVLVLPKGISLWAGCSWAGLGTIGPAYVDPSTNNSYAYAWIPGEQATSINAYFHELSHNLFIGHGSLYPVSTCQSPCDASTAMGPCCNIRCHNVIQAWQLGWLLPAPPAVVDSTLLAPAVTLQFSVSAFTSYLSKEDAMVVVYPDWVPAPPKGQKPWVLYISYRPLNQNVYDSQIPPAFGGGVLIHAWNGTAGLYSQCAVFNSHVRHHVMMD